MDLWVSYTAVAARNHQQFDHRTIVVITNQLRAVIDFL